MMADRELGEMFRVIESALDEAGARLYGMGEEMEHLEVEGMYCAVPSEQWQGRNGSSRKYLYMLFRYSYDVGGVGGFQGPDGKRKVYVGCKEERIREARGLAKNRVKWEGLQRDSQGLERWIERMRSDLMRLVVRAGSVPAGNLGRSRASTSLRSSPKM